MKLRTFSRPAIVFFVLSAISIITLGVVASGADYNTLLEDILVVAWFVFGVVSFVLQVTHYAKNRRLRRLYLMQMMFNRKGKEKEYETVDCTRCGAVITRQEGTRVKCEYCGSKVE